MTHPDIEKLKRELDRRADRDDAFWHAQRQAIQRKLREPSRSARPRRPVWALAGLGTAAAGALVAAALLLMPVPTPDAVSPGAAGAIEIDPNTTELLRSVEITLSSDVAPPLSAADVLLAEMEAEFALQQTRSDP